MACSPDGQQIAVVCGNEVQLWNAIRAEKLAPAFILNERAIQAQFSRDGNRLLVASADGAMRIMESFPRSAAKKAAAWNERPLEDCVALAQLLSGRQIADTQRTVPLKPEALLVLARNLQGKYPEEFAPVTPAIWHRQQAERAESERRWFAARFYWEQLLVANPANREMQERRKRADEEFAKSENPIAPVQPQVVQRIPDRAADTPARLIDLTRYYNAGLAETWLPTNVIVAGNDLRHLPSGVQTFAGVEFDARGLLQLSGSALEDLGAQFPKQVAGIEIRQKGHRLHFLHGAGWDALFGTVIGSYRLHYANGEEREIKLIFGQNIRDWWFFPTQRQPTSSATLAWQGTNPASHALGMALRLYEMSWSNPMPEVEIQSMDFISTMEKSAPFLIAVTVEP